ncbi:hypothetical protein TNCV_2472841 [Trichonephila clavipes]|nr:hypothetical protein TNCV_2472841 [Trichonephila clavipes]
MIAKRVTNPHTPVPMVEELWLRVEASVDAIQCLYAHVEYYTTHQAMPSEVPVDMWEGVDGLQFVGQAYPTHPLLDSSPVSMLVNPYG